MSKITALYRREALKLLGIAAGLGLATVLTPIGAVAQEQYPERAVRLIVPFPPGGTSDIIGRLAAHELSNLWGQQVIVENQAGATGAIGTRSVAESDPDGYTLVLANDSSQITHGLLNPPAAFDGINDFEPIIGLGRGQLILTVHPSLPVETLQELVDYAKANPNQINFGSSGIGAVNHFAGEMLKLAAEIDIVHVPYAGAAPAMVGLMSGETQINFLSAAVATGEILSGESGLKALATPSEQRWAGLPDVPTTAEAGYPTVLEESVFGILAPAGTPREIVDKINADLRAVLGTPEKEKQMLDLGFAPILDSPDDYKRNLIETKERKQAVIDAADISGG